MASYIEFVGVPGVGKTTMYKYLRTKYRKDSGWILYEELCKNKFNYQNGPGKFIRWYLQKLRKPGAIPRIPHNRYALIRFIENHPELIGSFWKVIEEKNSIEEKDLRLYKSKYIRDVLEKIQNVEDENTSRFCLIDEGLIHNLNYFTSRSITEELEKQIANTLDFMPLPVAVIYFDSDIETVVDRTISRGHMRPRDKFLTVKGLTASRKEAKREKEMFIEAVRSKGIPVLVLDSRKTLETKFQEIAGFINLLQIKAVSHILLKAGKQSPNSCKVERSKQLRKSNSTQL